MSNKLVSRDVANRLLNELEHTAKLKQVMDMLTPKVDDYGVFTYSQWYGVNILSPHTSVVMHMGCPV